MTEEFDEFGRPIVDPMPALEQLNAVPTGSQMSQDFLNEPFNPAWDDAKKELWGAKYESGVNMTPSDAAQSALRIREDQRKRELDALERASDPVRKATLESKQIKLNEARRVETDFQLKRDATIKAIEEILADKKSYEPMMGPFDGTVGAAIDAMSNEKNQAKRMRLDRLMNVDVLDMTKYLRPVSQDELKYLRTLVPKQTQHWEPTRQYLEEKLNMLKSAKRALYDPNTGQLLEQNESAQAQPNVFQQSQQNPASQLRSQLESSDTLTLPNGRVLKKIKNQDGSIGWSE